MNTDVVNIFYIKFCEMFNFHKLHHSLFRDIVFKKRKDNLEYDLKLWYFAIYLNKTILTVALGKCCEIISYKILIEPQSPILFY